MPDDRRPIPGQYDVAKELLQSVAPGMRGAQEAWLSQIESLPAPDRKTSELVRLACAVVDRSPDSVRLHAMLATEVGASWEDIAGTILLTEPAFGLLRAVEALPVAREAHETGLSNIRRDEATP